MTPPNDVLLTWVRGHADKKQLSSIEDLQSQQLSRDEIYNIWCDRMAGEAMTSFFPTIDDPDVYITEKWAIYSQYPTKHKIVGDLKRDLYSSLGFCQLQQYVTQKYQLTPAELLQTNIEELQGITAITIITNLISDLFLPLARYMLSVIILGLFRNVQGNISYPSEATDNQAVTYT
jgi:hypothetical protein